MGLSNFNATGRIKWDVENKDFPYIKLSQLMAGMEYEFLGFYITKDRGFGEGAVVITNGFNVNVPKKYVSIFRDMMRDTESIEQIKSGKAIFTYENYTTKMGNTSQILTFGIK